MTLERFWYCPIYIANTIVLINLTSVILISGTTY